MYNLQDIVNSVVDLYHFDADPDADSTYHPDADPDADPDSDFYLMRIRIYTFHPDTDPDPDPSFQIKAQILEKVLK
jgi:hypothetical protein